MSDGAALYQELILEHHRAPRNAGRLPSPTHGAEAHNPLCGDRLRLDLLIDGERVADVRCDVQGCALCRASGSMLTEAALGRTITEVAAVLDAFLALIAAARPGAAAAPSTPDEGARSASGEGGAELGPLLAFQRVREHPSRVRCVTLPWEALRRALSAATSAPR